MAGGTKSGFRRSLSLSPRTQAKEQHSSLSSNSSTQPSSTVLVVDDDPLQVELLGRLLSHQGMVAIPAYSGAQCLQEASQRSIDVIVLNVVMPEMNGLEVCAALKKRAPARSIPIIILSARDDPETRHEAMRLGVKEFVAKPARGSDLVARIRTHVGGSREARKRRQRQSSLESPRARK
jgi:PleD family two-component response regulator